MKDLERRVAKLEGATANEGIDNRKSRTLEAEDRIVARVLREVAAILGCSCDEDWLWLEGRLVRRAEELGE